MRMTDARNGLNVHNYINEWIGLRNVMGGSYWKKMSPALVGAKGIASPEV